LIVEGGRLVRSLRSDAGVTLLEIIVGMSLAGMAALIVLPVYHDITASEQARVDSMSSQGRSNFGSDWGTAGYSVSIEGGQTVVKDADGSTLAHM
jgi:prepilin-type N-terminal cleavage/methylation domain-containing protein